MTNLTPLDLDADRLREECGVFGIFGHPDAAAIAGWLPVTPPLAALLLADDSTIAAVRTELVSRRRRLRSVSKSAAER